MISLPVFTNIHQYLGGEICIWKLVSTFYFVKLSNTFSAITQKFKGSSENENILRFRLVVKIQHVEVKVKIF